MYITMRGSKKRTVNSNNLRYLNNDDEMESVNPSFLVLRSENFQ